MGLYYTRAVRQVKYFIAGGKFRLVEIQRIAFEFQLPFLYFQYIRTAAATLPFIAQEYIQAGSHRLAQFIFRHYYTAIAKHKHVTHQRAFRFLVFPEVVVEKQIGRHSRRAYHGRHLKRRLKGTSSYKDNFTTKIQLLLIPQNLF